MNVATERSVMYLLPTCSRWWYWVGSTWWWWWRSQDQCLRQWENWCNIQLLLLSLPVFSCRSFLHDAVNQLVQVSFSYPFTPTLISLFVWFFPPVLVMVPIVKIFRTLGLQFGWRYHQCGCAMLSTCGRCLPPSYWAGGGTLAMRINYILWCNTALFGCNALSICLNINVYYYIVDTDG